MSTEKSDPAVWCGESRQVFATLGSLPSPPYADTSEKRGRGRTTERGGGSMSTESIRQSEIKML